MFARAMCSVRSTATRTQRWPWTFIHARGPWPVAASMARYNSFARRRDQAGLQAVEAACGQIGFERLLPVFEKLRWNCQSDGKSLDGQKCTSECKSLAGRIMFGDR
mmetsp:Transcript_15927/g.33890  ORF Transcript_15927/g.33890 Transcript_15927/m.33890 type:complete len:106 (-) Transcript_15927:84-401(-)